MDLAGCHFTYAGVSSSLYGLRFVNCNTSEYTSINGKTKSMTVFNARGNRNHFISDSYADSPISFDAEVMTDDERPLTLLEIRNIEKWLFNRKDYYKLYVDTADDCDGETYEIIGGVEKKYYFNCRFVNPSKIFGNGGIVGFKFTIETDSMLLWQDTIEKTFEFEQEPSGGAVVSLDVNTDMNEYVYPKVTITTGATGSGAYSIVNDSDAAYKKIVTPGEHAVCVNSFGGRSIKLNQLSETFNSYRYYNHLQATVTAGSGLVRVKENRGSENIRYGLRHVIINPPPVGHIVLFEVLGLDVDDPDLDFFRISAKTSSFGSAMSPAGVDDSIAGVFTITSPSFMYLELIAYDTAAFTGTTRGFSFTGINFVDLTEMFGAGNEPSTVDQAHTLGVPRHYVPFNTGEIVSAEVTEIKSMSNNLLKPDTVYSDRTTNGITFHVNEDGSITASGTATDNADFLFLPSGTYLSLDSGVLCLSTGQERGSSDYAVQFDIYQDGTFKSTLQDSGTSWKKNYAGAVEIRTARLRIKRGATVNLTFYIKVEYGNTPTPYSKFGSVVDRFTIPSALLAFLADKGYGQSPIGGDGNTLDLANRKYTQAGSNTNGEWIALYEPVEYNISAYLPMDESFNFMLTEPGGSMIFKQNDDTELSVPQSLAWAVKNSEVTV